MRRWGNSVQVAAKWLKLPPVSKKSCPRPALRRKSETRNPKSEAQAPSDFGLRISFGFRFLVFGFAYGTTLIAGSLHGPGLLSAPMARTRAHTLAPLVSPTIVALDLLAVIFAIQPVGVGGSALIWIS